MDAILSLGIGYCIGCISPSAWLSKRKNVNLKQEGTKNLGATNTAIVLGRAAGVFVMFFDILKSYLSAKLARALFPQLAAAGMIACLGVIVGHCYPITMHFQGGKGLAAFGGMVLSCRLWFFPAIVLPGLVLMAIFNTGAAMPFLASIMFPFLVAFSDGSWQEILLAAITGCFILFMHRDNLKRAREKNDVVPFSVFLKNILFKKKDAD